MDRVHETCGYILLGPFPSGTYRCYCCRQTGLAFWLGLPDFGLATV